MGAKTRAQRAGLPSLAGATRAGRGQGRQGQGRQAGGQGFHLWRRGAALAASASLAEGRSTGRQCAGLYLGGQRDARQRAAGVAALLDWCPSWCATLAAPKPKPASRPVSAAFAWALASGARANPVSWAECRQAARPRRLVLDVGALRPPRISGGTHPEPKRP